MPADHIPAPALSDHLAEPLRLGEPDVHGPLAVFPVFGPAPVLEYVSFAQARAYGISIKELPSGAAVNDLVVLNPTDHTVLLYGRAAQPRRRTRWSGARAASAPTSTTTSGRRCWRCSGGDDRRGSLHRRSARGSSADAACCISAIRSTACARPSTSRTSCSATRASGRPRRAPR